MAAALDITVQRTLPVSSERVAAVMFDPALDQSWMKALSAVDVIDRPVAIGARVRRHAKFMGKDISWITVVQEYEPGRLLELRIAEGPFVGVVTYEIEPAGASSIVRIRNVGAPGQFAWMPGFLIRRARQSSLAKDLEHLEAAATSA
jgi:Polyketide cyclase / dehydrase and lipid transport.